MSARCSQTTAKGEPCKAYAIRGSDRCSAHLGRSGRPTALDESVVEALVTMLKAGNYLNVAVRAAGIGMQTYRDWLKRGQSSALVDAPYRDMRERVEKARADGEVRLVSIIASAARTDWRAALALLEREFPDRWGPVSVRVRELEPPPEVDVTPVDDDDPFREVDELAERRRSRVAG